MSAAQHRSGWIRAGWIAALQILVMPSVVRSADVPPDQMFLPPSTVVAGVYPSQPMSGGGASPYIAAWTVSDIAAIDPTRVDVGMQGIQVLPVLVPNPSPTSIEGEYTPADLASITVENYRAFYVQKPGTDINDPATGYAATMDPGSVTLTINAPGIYIVKIRTESRSAPGQPLEGVDYLFTEFATQSVFRLLALFDEASGHSPPGTGTKAMTQQ